MQYANNCTHEREGAVASRPDQWRWIKRVFFLKEAIKELLKMLLSAKARSEFESWSAASQFSDTRFTKVSSPPCSHLVWCFQANMLQHNGITPPYKKNRTFYFHVGKTKVTQMLKRESCMGGFDRGTGWRARKKEGKRPPSTTSAALPNVFLTGRFFLPLLPLDFTFFLRNCWSQEGGRGRRTQLVLLCLVSIIKTISENYLVGRFAIETRDLCWCC